MKAIMTMLRSGILLAAFTMFMGVPVTAVAFDDSDSLKGLTTGKAVFDVDLGDAGKLTLYLSVIKETHTGMMKQGVKPDLVVTFHGQSLALIQANRDKVPAAQRDDYDEVAMLIKDLKTLGVKFEACSVAARLLNVDPMTINKDVKVVGNTFISLTGYQNRGYALIPIH